jgi:hypothetical protein
MVTSIRPILCDDMSLSSSIHCKENPVYVFLFWKLRGLSPNFHFHVSLRDLYTTIISLHIFLQQNRQTDP